MYEFYGKMEKMNENVSTGGTLPLWIRSSFKERNL